MFVYKYPLDEQVLFFYSAQMWTEIKCPTACGSGAEFFFNKDVGCCCWYWHLFFVHYLQELFEYKGSYKHKGMVLTYYLPQPAGLFEASVVEQFLIPYIFRPY